jgi:hypothetical protein
VSIQTFKCFDCGKTSQGEPNLVLRQSKCGAGTARVSVCSKCLKGKQPEKRKSK